jgi:hypothetical protein
MSLRINATYLVQANPLCFRIISVTVHKSQQISIRWPNAFCEPRVMVVICSKYAFFAHGTTR